MGVGLWGLSPLYMIGISKRSVYQMTTSGEQARGEGKGAIATECGKEACGVLSVRRNRDDNSNPTASTSVDRCHTGSCKTSGELAIDAKNREQPRELKVALQLYERDPEVVILIQEQLAHVSC